MNIPEQLNALQSMTTPELAAQFEQLYGKPPRTRNPIWLRKRIAYRLQENAFGGLSRAARAAVDRLASAIQIPSEGDTGEPAAPERAPARTQAGIAPGTILQREWKGQQVRVQALADGGFTWNNQRFGSLSAVARAITGKRWNGWVFFGLRKQQPTQPANQETA